MYGMTDGYTAWILTLAAVGAAGAAWGLLLLIGHTVTEIARVRTSAHQAERAIADASAAAHRATQAKSEEAVARMQQAVQDR